MNHPHELLAEYVDGALPEGERAALSAHLDGCAECRSDVGAARFARRALSTLADGPVPEGLADAAIAEASRARHVEGAPRWYRLAGLAAAAAIVVLFAIALPQLLRSDSDPRTASLEGAAGAAAPAAPDALDIKRVDDDFDPESLAGLASGGPIVESAAPTEAADTTERRTGKVLDCLRAAFPSLRGRPVDIIHARFQGTDAYIGVLEDGPKERPDTRIALAASVRGCALLSYATHPI